MTAMYIIQYLICIAQACMILEHERYVSYNDKQVCEAAAAAGMKEVIFLLDGKGVKVVMARCIDNSDSIVLN